VGGSRSRREGGGGITCNSRLKGRQEVKVSLFIIAFKNIGQLGCV
jgi:hypothetical protein